MICDIEVMNSGLEVLIRSIENIDAKRFFVMVSKEKIDKKNGEKICA